MTITVEPARFTGLPLLTRAVAENDYNVLCDGLKVGRIMLRAVANSEMRWFWTITGPSMVQASLSSAGEAEDLDAAKKVFREQFDAWLSWALAADVAVYWHGS